MGENTDSENIMNVWEDDSNENAITVTEKP